MSSGEVPEFSRGDIKFDPEDALRFQCEVAIPAINYKWGGDFLEEVTPGSSLVQEKPLYAGQDAVLCRLECGQTIDNGQDVDDDYDPEDDETEIYMNLHIYKQYDIILDDLRKTYLLERIEALDRDNTTMTKKLTRRLRARTRQIESEIMDKRYTSWERTSYIFYPPESGHCMLIRNAFELRDEDNDMAWDTTSVGSRGSDAQEDLSDEIIMLQESFETTITAEDYFTIMDAFKVLGVPLDELKK